MQPESLLGAGVVLVTGAGFGWVLGAGRTTVQQQKFMISTI